LWVCEIGIYNIQMTMANGNPSSSDLNHSDQIMIREYGEPFAKRENVILLLHMRLENYFRNHLQSQVP